MVALKVTLPHISLSRTNSPSRPTTPSSTATTPVTGPASKPPSDRSSKPPSRSASMDSAGEAVTAAEMAAHKLNESAALDKEARARRASLGALGAALRRTTSSRVPSGASVVVSTPVHAKGLTPPSSRPSSDTQSGLIPLRAQLASSASVPGKDRSRSVDRRQVPVAAAAAGVTIQQSSSQPPLSRKQPQGKKSPVLTASGGATPVTQGSGRAPALHQLEESYVGKVSLKLGEAVNRVFMAGGGPTSGEIGFKGRPAPRVVKTREFGEIIVHELQAALHDAYLLRTLLRSSMLKALSLFLTRLTALLLPTDAVGPPPLTLKEADNLAPAMRFNLEVVRCAYELKRALQRAGTGAPSFVKETLRPWVDKLGEVMNRVMNPLILSIRIQVSLISAKARTADGSEPAVNGVYAAQAGHVPHTAANAIKQSGSQLRSLSMGRAAVPASPLAMGPLWLRELNGVLDATVRMISRLECGAEADKWLVSVGTHAVWKGMLSLASRRIPDDEVHGAVAVPNSAHHTTPVLPAISTAAAKSSLFKSNKRSPSPGDSPPLHPVNIVGSIASSSSPADVAIIRLLGELELLESRLNAFILSLSAVPNIDPDTLLSGKCSDEAKCGLCKTGRMFDPESSDDEEDAEDIVQAGGLAQYAMREAMQALSALIVVVRASRKASALKDALMADEGAGLRADVKKEGDSDGTQDTAIVPLTPMALISGTVDQKAAPLSPPPTPPQAPAQLSAATVASRRVCPTLVNALDTVPVLILLHLLASRLPVFYRLPHEIWAIEWRAYEKELRGFQAGEEWTAEVAWEMAGEVGRCIEEREMSGDGQRARLDVLAVAIKRKAGVEVPALESQSQGKEQVKTA